jgi:hypothetical protein
VGFDLGDELLDAGDHDEKLL